MKRKIFRRTSLVLVLAMILTAALSGSVFAASGYKKGDSVTFSCSWGDGDQTKFEIDDDESKIHFKGLCAQTGVDRPGDSGTAEVEAIYSADSASAKVAWYIYSNKIRNVKTKAEDYWVKSDEPWKTLLPEKWSDSMKVSHVAMNFIQISYQGKKGWKDGGNHLSSEDEANVLALYDWIVGGDSAPSNFEVIRFDPENSGQKFIAWQYNPTGSLTVSKTISKGSTSDAFTFVITVAGAEGDYSGVTFTGGTATVNLQGGQSVTIEGLPAGAAYSVTETNLPAKWKLVSKSGDSGTITDGATMTASFVNEPITGYAYVLKKSGNTDITG